MPKKENKKKQLEETHLKQNYVDENDLIPFLRDRFGEEFRIRTLEDGSKMVEAPRKLSEEEVEWFKTIEGKQGAKAECVQLLMELDNGLHIQG